MAHDPHELVSSEALEAFDDGHQDFGIRQEYRADSTRAQQIILFCRVCRASFRLELQAVPSQMVQCTCGLRRRLREFDVFVERQRAVEFVAFYTRFVREVKNVLRQAQVPIPASGRLRRKTRTGGPLNEEEYHQTLEKLQDQLDGAHRDVLSGHETLSRLIEHTYMHRKLVPGARKLCLEYCQQDRVLVPTLMAAARQKKRAGQRVKLRFTSFKHLVSLLEEEGELEAARQVAREAQQLGLSGYGERIDRLTGLIELGGTS